MSHYTRDQRSRMPEWFRDRLPDAFDEFEPHIQQVHVHALLEIPMTADWWSRLRVVADELAEIRDSARTADQLEIGQELYWSAVYRRIGERTKRTGAFEPAMRNTRTKGKYQ